MANTKGNAYPLWIIKPNYEVFAVNTDQSTVSKSNDNFALSIAIAEDGTVWVLSLTPDPDGGGSKLFWSDGDGNWNEINTSQIQVVLVSAGYTGSSCIVFGLRIVYCERWDTDGTSTVLYNNPEIPLFNVEYGGGMIWACRSPKQSETPVLSYLFRPGKNLERFLWKFYAV